MKETKTNIHKYFATIIKVEANGDTNYRQVWKNNDARSRAFLGAMMRESGKPDRIYNEAGYIDIHPREDSVSYHYYIRDYLGSVRGVVDSNGTLEQATDYHSGGIPSSDYGDFTADDRLHTGKEFNNFAGLAWYDNSARMYDPITTRFTTPDPLAEKYPDQSPYAHCANNPLNAIDPDGKIVIFINGFHFGEKGKPYWDGMDTKIMNQIKDWNAYYIDGSSGGWDNFHNNYSSSNRETMGYKAGEDFAIQFKHCYGTSNNSFTQSIKVITHSMGAAFAKGFIKALIESGVPPEYINFEADFAPYQPLEQKAIKGIKTFQFSHSDDNIVGKYNSEHGKISGIEQNNYYEGLGKHSISSFWNDIKYLPEGDYKVVDGEIIKQ